jgi:hypothetical protein
MLTPVFRAATFAPFAEVVELVDALRSGRSGRKPVRVRVPPSALGRRIDKEGEIQHPGSRPLFFHLRLLRPLRLLRF